MNQNNIECLAQPQGAHIPYEVLTLRIQPPASTAWRRIGQGHPEVALEMEREASGTSAELQERGRRCLEYSR
jgi:hypothetical protein